MSAPTRKRAWRAWLLPPVLALLAVGLQFALDVPHHPMLMREDPTPSDKKTTAARTKRGDAKSKQAKQAKRKRTKATTKNYRPRGAAYTTRLRASWSARPIADEPKNPRFAEHHEALLRAVARKAEAAAAPNDEPVLSSTRIACHTIRCDFELCAPTTLAEAIAEQLPRFHVGSRELWHELREVEGAREPKPGQACRRYIVDFAVEGADPRKLRVKP